MPVFQSVSDGESYLGSWLDIYVDSQGPFTQSVDGYRYILTYTCKLLRTPILVPCKTLQKDDAMQAISTTMLRTLYSAGLRQARQGPGIRICRPGRAPDSVGH